MPELAKDTKKRELKEEHSSSEGPETQNKRAKVEQAEKQEQQEEANKEDAESSKDDSETVEKSEGELREVSKPEETKKDVTEEVKNKDEAEVETKDEAKDEAKDETKDEAKDEAKDETKEKKPAFGQSSSFSMGFGAASKPFGSSTPFSSGFGAVKKTTDDKDAGKPSSGFSFGAGLSFGAGFKAAKVESKEDDKSGNETRSVSDTKESTSTPITEPIVKLTKQEIKSGEETEESLFQTNIKLYQLTDIKEGWKERGVGTLHLNKDKNSEKARIIMRSRGLLKVVLNLLLVKGFCIKKGFPGSLHGDKFVRVITVDENKLPVQYALRTAKPEIADQLYDLMTEHVPEN